MKPTLLFLSLVVSATELFAQLEVTPPRFYMWNGSETDSLNAAYFEIVRKEGEDYLFSSFYSKTLTPRSTDEASDRKNHVIRTFYFPDGTIKGKGEFMFSSPDGPFTAYYPNGSKLGEFYFTAPDASKGTDWHTRILNYWDSLGNKLIDNGNGYCQCNLYPFRDLKAEERGEAVNGEKHGDWQGRLDGGEVEFTEKYRHGVLLEGTQKRGGETFRYDQIEKSAMPIGGMIAFYQHVGRVMKYPSKARRQGVQGRVFVEFVVDRSGNLTEAKVVRGISTECDLEALKAVQSAPKWSPGLQRGRPVKQRMVLPITFKLG